VSSAANSKPSSPAPDAGKACVSTSPNPKTGYLIKTISERSSMTMHPNRL
jgi:hypothetical protein